MRNLFGVVVGFASYMKFRPRDKATTDDPAFRLHYNFTSGFFFLSTAILGLNEMFGKTINCIGKGSDGGLASAPDAALALCWVQGTYTVPGAGYGHLAGVGLQPEGSCLEENGGRVLLLPSREDVTETVSQHRSLPPCRLTHSYYQWVPFLFVLQGFLFKITRFVWKKIEEGKMQTLTEAVNVARTAEKEKRKDMMGNIARFIQREGRLTQGHRRYAYGFLVSCLFNIFTILLNFWLLDLFISGNFRNLGYNYLASSEGDRILKEIFPRITQCTFETFGTGGKEQAVNYLCLLATNIVTEKIFLFLWFWLLFLLGVSSAAFVYYSLILLCGNQTLRTYLLAFTTRVRVSKLAGLTAQEKTLKEKENGEVEKYLRTLPAPNYFFLYLLSSNIDFSSLQEILALVAKPQ